MAPYLESISVIFMEPCFADPGKIRLKARMSRDMEALLPYLNAVLPNAVYSAGAGDITFTRGQRIVVLHGQDLTLAKATNATDAYSVLDEIQETINDVHEQLDAITPLYERRRRPSVLDIMKWLPSDTYNCGACGYLGCLTFAVGLWQGEEVADKCVPLQQKDNHELYCALAKLLGEQAVVENDEHGERL